MKNKIYITTITLIIVLFGVFIFLRVKQPHKRIIKEQARTIVPVMNKLDKKSKSSNSINYKTETSDKTKFNNLKLFSNEELLHTITTDINQDGAEDYVFSVKKIADPIAYLIIALTDPKSNKSNRVMEIRTQINRIKTLNFYAIDSPINNMPAIVCTGVNSDNLYLLTMYAPKIKKDKSIEINVLADLKADGQISLKEIRNVYTSNSILYDIYTYNSDPNAENPLDQIKSIYRWSPDTQSYTFYRKIRIPGKKIEKELLRKLQKNNIAEFKHFLFGLWLKPTTNGNKMKSLYFNKNSQEIIFYSDNIQEMFKIDAINSRRYGLYLITKNQSISSIIRRVDIQLIGVDEIKIRVIENVARLKIGTASTWDGIYKKQQATTQLHTETINADDTFSELIKEFPGIWQSTDNAQENKSIQFTQKNTYIKTIGTKKEIGRYIIANSFNHPILELKNQDHNKAPSFFLIEMHKKPDNSEATLYLRPVKNTLNRDFQIIDEELVFTQQKE